MTKKSTKLRTGVFSTREIPVLIARAVKRDFFAFFGQELQEHEAKRTKLPSERHQKMIDNIDRKSRFFSGEETL
jgi:hypothetical protein